jgi:hypothetical protein
MQIKMKETVQGSLDGVTVQELVEGQEYSTVESAVGDRLAQAHITQGVAEAVVVPFPHVYDPVEASQ